MDPRMLLQLIMKLHQAQQMTDQAAKILVQAITGQGGQQQSGPPQAPGGPPSGAGGPMGALMGGGGPGGQ